MAIRLSELYKEVKDQKIELISGKGGIENNVKWVHTIETDKLNFFLDGQEVAFTTGVGLKDEDELLDLVEYIYKNNASGMVINTGHFIKKIPKEVIEFSDENDFPIFEVPWSADLAKIMRKFSYKITLSDRNHSELINALKNAIYFHDQRDLYVPHLEKHSYKTNWAYCLAIIDIVDKKNEKRIDKLKMNKYIKLIEYKLLRKNERIFLFELDDKLVLVFPKYTEEKIAKLMEKLREGLLHLSMSRDDIYICIGAASKNIYCIGKSYQKALDVLKLQKKKKITGEILTYNDLGIYKLLLGIGDKNLKREFYLETLEPLIKHDELNKTNYLEVLKSYIKFSGSVKEAAEELFCHRNTVNYKLKKIEEILECNLSDLSSRLLYGVALMLYDII